MLRQKNAFDTCLSSSLFKKHVLFHRANTAEPRRTSTVNQGFSIISKSERYHAKSWLGKDKVKSSLAGISSNLGAKAEAVQPNKK